MGVDHQFVAGAQFLAQRGDPVDRFGDGVGVEELDHTGAEEWPVVGPLPLEGVGLDGLVTVCFGLPRCLNRVRNCHAVEPLVLYVRVNGNVRPDRTAEELVDGLAERLAAYVPQRNVDCADEVRNEPPAVDGRVVPEDTLPKFLDVRGVFAYQQVLYCVDAAGEHLRGAVVRRLTQAGDPLVGLDLNEEPRVFRDRGVDVGPDVGDFHVATPPDVGWRPRIGR